MTLTQELESKIKQWQTATFDQNTHDEIQKLIDDGNENELTDAFYKDLEFGTGGLRGIMGVGSNRMNIYTIGKTTQGLSNFLSANFPNQDISVAIAYDSRNQSKTFAQRTAEVFASNKIKVYLFEALRPTPLLSFAIRHFKCQSGVVITASHNPKEYNGYKAYWTDGSQLTNPYDQMVMDAINKVNYGDIAHPANPDLIQSIGSEIDTLYLEALTKLSLNPKAIQNQKNLKIVYSPLHGTGITLVPKALAALGFENIHVVESQSEPNGNFPTVVYPNPEEAEAMSLALAKANELDADLVLATDPDADRVGIAIKNKSGEWQLMNGNQTAVLMMYYLMKEKDTQKLLKGNEYVVKTIVTTDLIDEIASKQGIECLNTLTGFKYIAEIIRNREGSSVFIAGAEESYGYMVGDFVRDKDAVSSCCIIAEMAAVAKERGRTLFDELLNIYQEHHLYVEKLLSITKKGKTGAEEIQVMMGKFRSNPPKSLGGAEMIELLDYQNQIHKNLQHHTEKAIHLEKSNVLQFILSDGSKISARPSGTEPKIKFYFSVKDQLNTKEEYSAALQKLESKIQAIIQDLALN